jgi:hypothetical protein
MEYRFNPTFTEPHLEEVLELVMSGVIHLLFQDYCDSRIWSFIKRRGAYLFCGFMRIHPKI